MHGMDNINTWTGLSVKESIRMTEDRDKWKKIRPWCALGSRTAKEQNCPTCLDEMVLSDSACTFSTDEVEALRCLYCYIAD